MVVVAKVSFPRRYLKLAVTAYTGLPALPPEVPRSGPFFRAEEDRVKAITFYTLPKDAEAALLASLRDRYSCFTTVPDFNCDIREWREYREALAEWVE